MKVLNAGFLSISKKSKMECLKKWNLCWGTDEVSNMAFNLYTGIFLMFSN